jgi:phosphomannomutase
MRTVYPIIHICILSVIFIAELAGMSTCAKPSNRLLLLKQYQKASNGFDLRGCTVRTPGLPLLTTEAAFWIGVGFSHFLRDINDNNRILKVGIGRDPRESGIELSNWLISGIESSGNSVEAYDVGLCTTPSMFLSCSEVIQDKYQLSGDSNDKPWPFDGAISITASHLPSMWNGFKMFTPNHPTNIGEEGIAAVIDFASNSKYDDLVPRLITPIKNSKPFLPVYGKFLQHTIRQLIDPTSAISDNNRVLTGLKVSINAGNGAGGFLAATLSELGADTTSSVNLTPDGRFPNHIPNPEDKIAIATTANATTSSGSDIGVCLDCDADRVGIVDGATGTIVNRNKLIALVSRIALDSNKHATIVTDSATSNSITDYIENTLGGKHLRYKKGYRYVIEKARSIPDSVLAFECSGHGAWQENGWIDDGCYTAIKIIATLMKDKLRTDKMVSMSQMIGNYSDPIESHEFRLRMSPNENITIESILSQSVSIANETASALPGWTPEPENYEGVRVNFNNRKGWLMLRSSLHEPILSLHIESDAVGGIHYACSIMVDKLQHLHPHVDLSSLRNYLPLL